MTLPTIYIRLSALIAVALMGSTIGHGQSTPAAAASNRIEAAGTFTYVHTNAPPGGCGCFSMYGVSGSGAYYYGPHFALVADVSFVHTGNADNTAQGLSFTSYLVGARLPLPLHHARIVPFGQILIGVTHESGSFAHVPATGFQNDSEFSAAGGAGLDYRLTPRLTMRTIEVEYLLTRFPNGLNSRQNDLRLESGLAMRF
jgi:peptidoglycan-associated lipoprotein